MKLESQSSKEFDTDESQSEDEIEETQKHSKMFGIAPDSTLQYRKNNISQNRRVSFATQQQLSGGLASGKKILSKMSGKIQ